MSNIRNLNRKLSLSLFIAKKKPTYQLELVIANKNVPWKFIVRNGRKSAPFNGKLE